MKTSRSEDFRRKILFRTNVFRFIVFFKLEVFHSLDFQQQQLHIKIEKKIDFFGGRFFFRFVTLFVSGPTGKKDSRPKLFFRTFLPDSLRDKKKFVSPNLFRWKAAAEPAAAPAGREANPGPPVAAAVVAAAEAGRLG